MIGWIRSKVGLGRPPQRPNPPGSPNCPSKPKEPVVCKYEKQWDDYQEMLNVWERNVMEIAKSHPSPYGNRFGFFCDDGVWFLIDTQWERPVVMGKAHTFDWLMQIAKDAAIRWGGNRKKERLSEHS